MMLRAQINFQKRQINVPGGNFTKIFSIKDGISRLFFVPVCPEKSYKIIFISILYSEYQQTNPH